MANHTQIIHNNIYKTLDNKVLDMSKKRTFYFELPQGVDVATIIQTITIGNTSPIIIIPTGIATVHPKDRFIKSIGREVAKNNIKDVVYSLQKIEMFPSNEYVIIFLLAEWGSARLKLNIKTFNTKVLSVDHK